MVTGGTAIRPMAMMVAGMVCMLAAVAPPPDPLSSFAPDGFLDAKKQVYARRSHVDVLLGFWGGLTRRIVESRIKGDGPSVLEVIRRRIEGGDPPARGLPAT